MEEEQYIWYNCIYFLWLVLQLFLPQALSVLPKMGPGVAASKTAMAAYLFMWGLFTLVMFIST